jgi:hypothetical protein
MIIADLALKGMSARANHQDLVTVLGCSAAPSTSVTHYLREVRCLCSDQDTASVEIENAADDTDQAI